MTGEVSLQPLDRSCPSLGSALSRGTAESDTGLVGKLEPEA